MRDQRAMQVVRRTWTRRLRHWLLLKLAGGEAYMLNAHVHVRQVGGVIRELRPGEPLFRFDMGAGEGWLLTNLTAMSSVVKEESEA